MPEHPPVAPIELVVRDGASIRRVPYTPGDTVLETLRRAQIEIPTQCERAYCGSCMFTLLKGEVRLRVNDVLSEAELAEGLRVACQGIPEGEMVEIELF